MSSLTLSLSLSLRARLLMLRFVTRTCAPQIELRTGNTEVSQGNPPFFFGTSYEETFGTFLLASERPRTSPSLPTTLVDPRHPDPLLQSSSLSLTVSLVITVIPRGSSPQINQHSNPPTKVGMG